MILFLLGHNFWTKNVRKSIKGSKVTDSSLVSNENFNEILSSIGWALGQVMSRNDQKPILLMTTLTKKMNRLQALPSLLKAWTAL